MKRARLSDRAEADLSELWWFIAQDSVTEADRFIAFLREKCQKLAETPGIGRERTELARGLRGFPTGNYIIFYREAAFGIEVARIMSGYRDIPQVYEE